MKKPASRSERSTRHGWLRHVVVIGFVAPFLLYAFSVLTDQAETQQSATGLLPVRTDLMRGRACHVANATIMGDCTEAEIEELEREHGSMASQ